MVAKFRVKYIHNKKEKGKREEKERERRKMCRRRSATPSSSFTADQETEKKVSITNGGLMD